MIASRAGLPGIKQFTHEGCLSYLFFDQESGVAAAIDPRADLIDDYREFLAENRLRPVIALDTHLHPDHYSGTHFFAHQWGCPIGMSTHTSSRRVQRKLAQGDRIQVGRFVLETLETPGHTPDSICFVGAGVVFTGDTLLIASSGRTDFPMADSAALWRSIQGLLSTLPEETLVFPGHDEEGLICSTIGVEKNKNPHALVATSEDFITLKRSETLSIPIEDIRRRVEFNSDPDPKVCQDFARGCQEYGLPRVLNESVASINVSKLEVKLKEMEKGSLFLDVRERSEFREGHLPGTENIPLSEIGLHRARLMASRRVYLSCLSGGRSLLAAKTINYWGHLDVVNVSGGYRAWVKAGFPVLK